MTASVPVPGRGSGQLEDLLAEAFPRMLMLQTTSACNSSCVFCPHQSLRSRLPQGTMDHGLFREIVVEAGRHPQLACINLFLMNEPLTDPHLVERIQLAKDHNPRTQLSLWTNGVALDPAFGSQLLNSPLSSIGVSLHAHRAETYRRLTRRRDFDRILRNVVHFVEQRNARRPDLTVAIRYVSAGAMARGEEQELTRFWSDGNVVLDIDQGFLSRAGNQRAPGEIRRPHRRLAGCRALGGPKQAHILFSGEVVLCCMDYRRTTCLGDRSRQSLEAIWSGSRRKEILETLYGVRPADPRHFLCSRCELAVAPGTAHAPPEPPIPDDPIWAAI